LAEVVYLVMWQKYREGYLGDVRAATRKKVMLRERNRTCREKLMTRVAKKKMNETMPAVANHAVGRRQSPASHC